MNLRALLASALIAWTSPGGGAVDPGGAAAPKPNPQMIPRFLAGEYRALEAARPRPPDGGSWKERAAALRASHAKALGVPPAHGKEPISFVTLGTLDRDGYELRKIVFESRPGLPVPAHIYLPKGRPGPLPAVLSVHGHWQNAKSAPTVQLRNIFLAKRGYVVLCLDAIGAGERAYRDPAKGPIAYHGRQLGYGVLPSGLTLAGLQIEENRRALDLLESLPEVDPSRIGCTGASGGGNQTFNLSVLDERVRAAAAVCFYGAYRGYLEGAHCACELAPGVLRYGEEGDLAGSVAPRSLLIIAAVKDKGAAFRIEDARRNIETARKYFAEAGVPDRLSFLEFDCDHDYNREMREAMVAFFDRHLRGIETGERVAEPPITPEDLETLRCFSPEGKPLGPAGTSREILTVPLIARDRSRELIAEFRARPSRPGQPGSGQYPIRWGDPKEREALRRILGEEIFGGPPAAGEPFPEPVEPDRPVKGPARILVILGGGGARYRGEGPKELPADVLRVEFFPRGTGPTAWPGAAAVDCPDYVLAQGTAVLGKPILGVWTFDALHAVERLAARYPGVPIGLYGEGTMGITAILAAALSDRVAAVGAVDSLASYEWPTRFDDRWPLAVFVPGLLRAGDLPDIAAAIPPRTFAQGCPRDGGGSIIGGNAEGPAEVMQKMLRGMEGKLRASAEPAHPTWKITPLHTGICTMGKNHLLGDPFTDDERVPFSLISFLLEGPGGDLAIVDFGPKDPAYFNESFRRIGLFRERAGDREHPDDVVQPDGNVLAHLKRLRIEPGRVKHIIFTHLHYDHMGGSRPPDPGLLRDFPGAILHISKRGWDDNLARRADGWRWTSYIDFDMSQEILIRGKEGRARFEDDEEIAPGLRTRYLGGHSVCSQAVLVEAAEGTAVIAGDVIYHYEYLEKGIVARLRTTPEDYIRALRRIIEIADETRGILLPVHDPKILEAFRARPSRPGEPGSGQCPAGWLGALKEESDRAVAGFKERSASLRILETQKNKD